MKEIDFDELHQAVSKLMDQNQKSSGSKKLERPVAHKALAPKVTAHAAKLAGSAEHAITVRHPAPVAKVGNHRGPRGAVMDIVQPRMAEPAAPPSGQVRRTARALEPRPQSAPSARPTPAPESHDTLPSATPTPLPSALLSGGGSLPVSAPQDISDELLASLDMPGTSRPAAESSTVKASPHANAALATVTDPAADSFPELSTLQLNDEAHKTTATPSSPDDTLPALAVTPEETTASTPTPFVTTSVEKRPLGAFTETPKDNDYELTTPNTADPEPAESPAPHTDPEAGDAGSPLPKELDAAVLAAESGEIHVHVNESKPAAAPASQLHANASPAEALLPAAHMAIPQQYKASKTTSDVMRPVFDTKDYHPPLHASVTPPTKSKGVWIALLIVVALLLTLYGAYVLLTGSLDPTAWL